MDQQYPNVTKLPVLDTGKFKQWQFQIQKYLQHEHYALWEVIEFGDSYVVHASPSVLRPQTQQVMNLKKSEPNSHNMAFISSAKHSSRNEDGNTACVSTASTNVPTAPKNQERGRRDNYRQGSKAEEQAPKALMAIDGVGWD
nr:hypothetical protein [Tanacetum cinerariifolium]